ncbi:galactose-3-O-sulfotransferase 2-like [Littorina saxatilis]|uniref:galactose-3-O-sulfotransferase 2-like n=1 Tax=Littorina saxatilis TaxID=31220 RepID=UPI0038B6A0D7
MLNRYALTHNLTVAVRNNLQEHEAERTTQWTPLYRPLPPGLTHYDMLTDHVRLNEECVRHFLPRDTQFVSIVREPLQAFISAFYYYRDVWSVARYLAVPGKSINQSINMKLIYTLFPSHKRTMSSGFYDYRGPDPIKTFLSDIERWEFPPGTQCNSRMAFDFGLDMLDLPDPQYVNSSLRHLSQVFHQVLLTEQFDESMVLLKRHLHWELKDVLYVKVNVGPTTRRLNVSDHDRKEFEKHRQGEYTLYRHFRRDFEQRIASEGATFRQEVDVFKKMRDAVEAFCTIANKSKARELTVASTAFSEGFRVAYEDCKLLQRMSSTIKDPWFEKLMIERINNLSKALQHWT